MRLRTAMKIRKAIGTKREYCYQDSQLEAALDRYEKTASHKEAKAFFANLMERIGPEGRAYVIGKSHPGWGLEVLLRESKDRIDFSNG